MRTDIVIIIAMESERRHLDDLLPGWEAIESRVWRTLRRGNVVTITCGIGMVTAAAATQHAITAFEPKIILNYGCAGAHTRELFPGDVVIGQTVIHHGRMRFAGDGEVVPLDFGFTVPGESEKTQVIRCDEELVRHAESLIATMTLPIWPLEIRVENQPDRDPLVVIGTVSSGDIWLQHPERIDAGNARTGSLCEDMEAAAIGQICAMYGVPFLTIKDISNSEFHEQTTFEGTSSDLPSEQVGLRAAMVIAGLVESTSFRGIEESSNDLGPSPLT